MPKSMRSPKRWLRPLLLCTLVLPLGACSPEVLALLQPPTGHPAVGTCPALEAPPDSVVAALDAAARTDPEATKYEIALAKHYDKLDACGGAP